MRRDDQECEREYFTLKNATESLSRGNVKPSRSVVVSQQNNLQKHELR